MTRSRIIVGFIASGLLLLSSMMHTILGAQAMLGELHAAKIPMDLEQSLLAGWQFGGVMMLVASLICGHVFLQAKRGNAPHYFAPRVIGAGYVLFGLWAMIYAGMEPFYFAFIVPGVMLLFAARE